MYPCEICGMIFRDNYNLQTHLMRIKPCIPNKNKKMSSENPLEEKITSLEEKITSLEEKITSLEEKITSFFSQNLCIVIKSEK
jgi:hypothetical protein